MKEESLKIKKNTIVVSLILVFFALGFYFGKLDINDSLANTKNTEQGINFSSFLKVWNLIDEKHPNAKNINNETRIYGAISGLVNSLNDPYSIFLDPEEKEFFEDDIAGNFIGVGMEIGFKDKILTVIAPLKDTPAYKAGIKSGDKILKIDDTNTIDLPIEKSIKLIRGERGTEVRLTIFNEENEEPKEIKIIRDIIEIPTLDTELLDNNIFVIKLYSFSENSAYLFENAIKDFINSKSDKLILDLRGNPGGYLEKAVDISSWFLKNGEVVLIEDYISDTEEKKYRSRGYNITNIYNPFKMVVLIDSGSASASEIVAGAMQDHKVAKLVGEKSFGKGSVQEVVNVTYDTLLKITVAKWLTPNGNSISEKGLTPDFIVPITKEDLKNKKDPQLEKAIYLLNNW